MNRKLSWRSSPPPLPWPGLKKRSKQTIISHPKADRAFTKDIHKTFFLFLHKLEIYLMKLFPPWLLENFFFLANVYKSDLFIFYSPLSSTFPFSESGWNCLKTPKAEMEKNTSLFFCFSFYLWFSFPAVTLHYDQMPSHHICPTSCKSVPKHVATAICTAFTYHVQ